MEKLKFVVLTLLTLITILPLTSAIFVGEATSEPTIIQFTISEPTTQEQKPTQGNRHSQIQAQINLDESIEAELREVTYSDWTCINNRIQRTRTTLNNIEYEYGQACNIAQSEHTNTNNILTILTIFLAIFILLTLILIVLILIIK